MNDVDKILHDHDRALIKELQDSLDDVHELWADEVISLEGWITKAKNTLVNVAQVFDGWHQDGTAWTAFDESVRREIADLLTEAGEREK